MSWHSALALDSEFLSRKSPLKLTTTHWVSQQVYFLLSTICKNNYTSAILSSSKKLTVPMLLLPCWEKKMSVAPAPKEGSNRSRSVHLHRHNIEHLSTLFDVSDPGTTLLRRVEIAVATTGRSLNHGFVYLPSRSRRGESTVIRMTITSPSCVWAKAEKEAGRERIDCGWLTWGYIWLRPPRAVLGTVKRDVLLVALHVVFQCIY